MAYQQQRFQQVQICWRYQRSHTNPSAPICCVAVKIMLISAHPEMRIFVQDQGMRKK